MINKFCIFHSVFSTHFLRFKYSMAVGTGGQGGGAIAPPPIFCQPKKFKSLKITTYKSVYSNKDKIGL